MPSLVLSGERPHALIVAVPVHDAVQSYQMSFSIAHEPQVLHVVAPVVDTLAEPALIVRRFSQSSPTSRALQEHEDLGLEAQSKKVEVKVLRRLSACLTTRW